jgi:predicted RNA binding protein YcfA (HicA-like mRNA interferase family)
MASLPVVSGDEVCRALTRNAVVPLHKELALGTLRSILKQAGLSDDQFRALL